MASSSSVATSAVPPIGHAVGGALGSALALLLFYPLERSRIEMQSEAARANRQEIAKVSVAVEVDNHSESAKQYTGIPSSDSSAESWVPSSDSSAESWVSCASERQIRPVDVVEQSFVVQATHNDGLLPTLSRLYDSGELYKGAGSVVMTLATSSFVFFYAHQVLQTVFVQRNKKSAILSLLGSSFAGMINVLITNPLWVANLRIIKGAKSSLWRELHAIVKSEGWKALWNGTGTSLLLVSNPVLQFFVYEQAKASRLKKRTTLSPIEAFCVGALAKAIATVATYPLQLAQVLLRLQKGEENVGTWGCLKEQYKRGGVKALYTGMNAKLLQTVLTAAFTFLTYEQILRVVSATLLMTAQKKEARQKQSGGLGNSI